uniref:Uncharacterized protein n=1 Tax=Oncorhynchus kisutch TaxID=8019 RepID=A0A8C7J147_ONCKI
YSVNGTHYANASSYWLGSCGFHADGVWGLSATLWYYTYNSPNTTGDRDGRRERGPAPGVKGVREEIQGRDGGGSRKRRRKSCVRLLFRDTTECRFSFICTSNNQISHIQGSWTRPSTTTSRPCMPLQVPPQLPSTPLWLSTAMWRRWTVDPSGYLQAGDSLRTLPRVGPNVCLCCACGHVWQITEQDYSCAAVNGRQPWGPYARMTLSHSQVFCEEEKVTIKVAGMGKNKKICNKKVCEERGGCGVRSAEVIC